MAVSDHVLLKIKVSILSSPSKCFGCSSYPHGAEESSKPQRQMVQGFIFLYKVGTCELVKTWLSCFSPPEVSHNDPQAFAISQLPHQ